MIALLPAAAAAVTGILVGAAIVATGLSSIKPTRPRWPSGAI